MTIYEILKQSIDTLSSIHIPISQIGDVGQPVATVINQLGLCCKAIDEAEEKRKEEGAREAETEGEAETEADETMDREE